MKTPILRQAIVTKVLPATEYKAMRMKATCSRGSMIVHIDPGWHFDEYHSRACHALIERFVKEDVRRGVPIEKNPWWGPVYQGVLPDFSNVFVFRPIEV